MEINKISYSPNFQAKLIIGDERIQKFIKSSFLNDSKSTFNTLDNFFCIYPDSVVSVNIKSNKNRDYLVAKNGITGAAEAKLLHGTTNVAFEDRMSFIELIKKIMNKKSFWNKATEPYDFDATAIPQKIEHNVFKLD